MTEDTVTALAPRLASGALRSERLTEDALATIAEAATLAQRVHHRHR